ncbi:MAG: potassium transporter [Bacteroidetes bacterium]|nr:potassium transporter [Bacteroidota bacterium]
MVASIFLLGIAAQLISQRVRVPSVLFLIAIGLALGEEGAGLITFELFGEGLSVIVGLSVAIIVFDGAFQLRLSRLQEAATVTLRLVTLGAALTLLGTAAAVYLLLGVSVELSLLVGALLVATGPTVITPILEVVRVREHVASVLEAEGIINDVTAAITAIVVYEAMLHGDGGALTSLGMFAERMGVGIAAGGLAAWIIYQLLTRNLVPRAALQVARFLFLSAGIGAFALAELVAAEAGVAAAATAGVILGNLDLPHRETMETFGRDLTLIFLSFVFIALAALIDIGAMVALGVAGIAVVAAIVLAIRPLVIALATVGEARFTVAERLFLSAVGPRGIIPASVATLFALELAAGGDTATAEILTGAVFLVIFVTVVLEAGLARYIARVGTMLATRLQNRGEFVIIVENEEAAVDRARDAGFTVEKGDGTEPETLRRAGIAEAKQVVAVTQNDNDNLLVCQLARAKFGVPHVYARVNKTENAAAFNTLDVTAIDVSMASAHAIDNEIERPALNHWMNELGEGHDVQEVELTAKDLIGQSIREVNPEIPDGCIIVVVGRNGETYVPAADDRLEAGDRVTFAGDEEAVRKALQRFHPHD